LVEQVQWLVDEVVVRGGLVSPIGEMGRAVSSAIKRLGKMVKMSTPGKTLEPLLRPRDSHRLDLAYYRNQCLHIFVEEAVVLVALVSMQSNDPSTTGRHRVRRQDLHYASQVKIRRESSRIPCLDSHVPESRFRPCSDSGLPTMVEYCAILP